MSEHKTTDHACAREGDPADICARLRDPYPRNPNADRREAAAEIGRLRAIIRVNGLRAGATHEQIDEVIYGKR